MVLDSNVHKLKVHLKSGTLHLHQQLTIFFVYFVSNVHNSSEKVNIDNCNVYSVVQKERMFLKWACDFFLWGYLKSKAYVRKPRTVDDLKVSIREEIATVPQELLVNVMQNFEERLRTCVRQEGRHLSDIIFRN